MCAQITGDSAERNGWLSMILATSKTKWEKKKMFT